MIYGFTATRRAAETPEPDLAAARAFACVIRSQYPDKPLAYSCSPASDWHAYLDEASAVRFRRELAALGYRFQAASLAGFRALDEPAPRLAGQHAHAGGPACAQPYEAELVLMPGM